MNPVPIVVSYGMGTNSTGLLGGMLERGQRPDLILSADTGDEKPHTYKHLEAVQTWCRMAGFPPIIVVRNSTPQALRDGSLSNECIRLGTLPAKAFGYSSCSIKWKIDPQNRYLKKWMEENKIPFIIQCVGYDADEIHRSQKKIPDSSWKMNWYPLIEWDWGRDECIAAIDRMGLERPGKSACFMCPSSKKPEVVLLKQQYPVLYQKAIRMEARALAGEGQARIDTDAIKGIGRTWNWQSFAGSDVATPEVDCGCYDGAPE